jgi:hypothetical protein
VKSKWILHDLKLFRNNYSTYLCVGKLHLQTWLMLSKLFWKYPISYIWAKHGLKFKVVSLNPKNNFLFILHLIVVPFWSLFCFKKKESKIDPFWSWFRIATFLVDAQTFPESTLKLWRVAESKFVINIHIYIWKLVSQRIQLQHPFILSRRILLASKWQLDFVANPGCLFKDLYSLEVQ